MERQDGDGAFGFGIALFSLLFMFVNSLKLFPSWLVIAVNGLACLL